MGAVGSKTPKASTKQARQAGAMFDDVELHVIKLTYKDLAGLSRTDKRGEAIDKATFLQNFPVPGLVGDRLFAALDKQGTGRISFDDFVVGLAVCCRGSMEEKMRFVFGVYDMDGDGLISRDELLLMLNQVPRTLLSIGGADASDTFPAHTIGGDARGTPRRARTLSHSRAGDESIPRHVPASLGRKRRVSVEPVVGGARKTGRPVVNPAFTNESIADQALQEFGAGTREALDFDQFQKWAAQTPAVQALLQGAFPTDSHFSLATSPRARRASCESLIHESPARRSSHGPTAASDAAATAVAAVVGWSASRSGSRQSTPRHSRQPQQQQPQQSGVDAPDPVMALGTGTGAGTATGPGFFAPSESVGARTPLRAHSRNTSYDNLLRSPIVGQGLMAADSPMPRSAAAGRRTPGGGGRTTPRASQAKNEGTAASGGGEEGGRPHSSRRRSTGGIDQKGLAAATVWRWGEEPEPARSKVSSGVKDDEDSSSASTLSTAPPPQSKEWDSSGSLVPSGVKDDKDASFAATFNTAPPPKSKEWDVPAPLTCGRIRLRDSSHASPSRSDRHDSSGDADDAPPPPPATATLRRCSSEVGAKVPLPPLASRPSPLGSGELFGKARKLARMARVTSSGELLSCQDIVALSLAERNSATPAHDGRVTKAGGGGESEGKRRGIANTLRPMLRHSRSFSHIESSKLARSAVKKFGTPSSEKRRFTAKVGGKPASDNGKFLSQSESVDVIRGSGEVSVTVRKDRADAVSMTPPSGAALAVVAGIPGQQQQQQQQQLNSRGKAKQARSPVNMAALSGGAGSSTPSRGGSRVSGGGMQTPSSGGGGGGGGGGDVPLDGVTPATNLELGVPVAQVSVPPELMAGGDAIVAANTLSSTVGAEAVVRDCLYNSHGIVALDGYLWKPGSMRVVKRWMMLVDNTLYYFIKPGDKKPRGVISLPGCIAEVVEDEEAGDSISEASSASSKKEPRKNRVPKGFYGLRLLRPYNHAKEASCRLFLAKTPEEREEWVAELRVASRVVPLEEHFELQALLRKGAFASVHRGVHQETGEEYAIKVIDKTSLSSHEKSLLRGEIGALKLVSHPNVVRLEAVHEDPRSISIVMTLCRGGDLWDKVRAQPNRCFTTTQARLVMRPLCEAVLYLHDLGILHRDIKPENILLVENTPDNSCLTGVILSDFGFSHQVSPKSRLACGKQLMGTPSYMAPESILHGMYGKEVDWFACGCVLYMMLMGRAPFAGANPSEIFRNTCNGRLGLGRGGANHWDRLPAGARDLIVGLMQLDHNLRFTGEQAMRHPWLARTAQQQAEEDDITVTEKGISGSGRRQHRDTEVASTERRRHHERRSSRSQSEGRDSKVRSGKFINDDGHQTPPNVAGSQASTSCASSSSSSGGGGGPRETERETPPPGIAEGEIVA